MTIALRWFLVVVVLSGCAEGGGQPPRQTEQRFPGGQTETSARLADRVDGPSCSVSSDGFVWYALPSGAFPPIEFSHVRCTTPTTLAADVVPPVPTWARPTGPTQAIFVATSLQEAYSVPGMVDIENVAERSAVPVTWMVGNTQYLTDNAVFYNNAHAANGDDVELEDAPSLYAAAKALPWYSPSVSVEGAGRERNIAGAVARGNHAFWGITWNSHGTDSTTDLGAPWGSYCADVSSYKRPSPSGDCSLVAFEWTARDLTRAVLTDTSGQGYSAEAAFSTDPDDILLRASFDPASGAIYARRIVDAYAAAGASQPLIVMSQQESREQGTRGSSGDDAVLSALYDEAKSVGMRRLTLRDASTEAATFSAKPRAIAFPFFPGGIQTAFLNAPFGAATIDYHDDAAGMTFLAGQTMPMRVFEYADDPISYFNRALVELVTKPDLTRVSLQNHTLAFHFRSFRAMHYGIALWTDPARLGLMGSNVTPASRAGVVITFDLPSGDSDQFVSCSGCTSTTFSYGV